MLLFQTMKSDIYLRQSWVDHRLIEIYFEESLSNITRTTTSYKRHSETGLAFVSIIGEEADSIWHPNVFFIDAVTESTPGKTPDTLLLYMTKGKKCLLSANSLIL